MNLSVRCQYWKFRTIRFSLPDFEQNKGPFPIHFFSATSKSLLRPKAVHFWLKSIPHREICSHLSPYTRWRFLLGLPPGVISLCFPASSYSFKRALLSAFGSTASAFKAPTALSLRAPFCSVAFLSDFLFSAPGGGVAVRGGVATGGVFKEFAALA